MPRIERPAPAIGPVRHEQCHQNHPTMAAVKAVGIGRALQQWRWSEEQLPQKHILLLACRREGDMIIENRIRSRIELKTKFAQGKVVVLAPGINHGIDETFWEAWWAEFGDSLAAEHLKVITPHIGPPLIPSPSRRRRRRHRTSSALVLSMPNNATLRRIVLGRLAMFGTASAFLVIGSLLVRLHHYPQSSPSTRLRMPLRCVFKPADQGLHDRECDPRCIKRYRCAESKTAPLLEALAIVDLAPWSFDPTGTGQSQRVRALSATRHARAEFRRRA
jgi:hypothetical protein